MSSLFKYLYLDFNFKRIAMRLYTYIFLELGICMLTVTKMQLYQQTILKLVLYSNYTRHLTCTLCLSVSYP